jgi:hypothetical protein
VRAVLAAVLSATGLAHAALHGRVVDETGGPLRGATVTLHKLSSEQFDESSQTDSEGRYSFPELPDGEYSVEGSLTGFVAVSYKPLRIYFPANVECNFVLRVAGFGGDAVYATSQIVGELRWRGDRVPLAKICLASAAEPRRQACTTTNRLGQYFLDVPPAIYVVTVDDGAGLHVRQRLDMSAAGEYRNKIVLEAGGGAPAAEATLSGTAPIMLSFGGMLWCYGDRRLTIPSAFPWIGVWATTSLCRRDCMISTLSPVPACFPTGGLTFECWRDIDIL